MVSPNLSQTQLWPNRRDAPFDLLNSLTALLLVVVQIAGSPQMPSLPARLAGASAASSLLRRFVRLLQGLDRVAQRPWRALRDGERSVCEVSMSLPARSSMA